MKPPAITERNPMTRSRRLVAMLAAAAACAAATPGAASADTSHDGWPEITGMLLINGDDTDRPLDGRPGKDPFGGQDSSYSCDTVHWNTACIESHDEFSFGPNRRCENPGVT